jgi:hypothetical protein
MTPTHLGVSMIPDTRRIQHCPTVASGTGFTPNAAATQLYPTVSESLGNVRPSVAGHPA